MQTTDWSLVSDADGLVVNVQCSFSVVLPSVSNMMCIDLKNNFSKSRKSQFAVKTVKWHLIYVKSPSNLRRSICTRFVNNNITVSSFHSSRTREEVLVEVEILTSIAMLRAAAKKKWS